MSKTKKLLLSLASLFLAYRSMELVKFSDTTYASQFSWPEVIIYSFVLNLFVTGIFAFLGFAFLTSRMLPNAYYEIKNAKNLLSVYKCLGVKYFQRLLLAFYWGKEKNKKKYFNGTKSGLNDFDTQTRQSEFGHLAAFLFIGVISVFLLLRGHVFIFCISTLINLIGNLYPIVLQRFHRIQIERLRRLSDRINANNSRRNP